MHHMVLGWPWSLCEGFGLGPDPVIDYGDASLVHGEDGRSLVCYLRFLYGFRHLIEGSLGVCPQIEHCRH